MYTPYRNSGAQEYGIWTNTANIHPLSMVIIMWLSSGGCKFFNENSVVKYLLILLKSICWNLDAGVTGSQIPLHSLAVSTSQAEKVQKWRKEMSANAQHWNRRFIYQGKDSFLNLLPRWLLRRLFSGRGSCGNDDGGGQRGRRGSGQAGWQGREHEGGQEGGFIIIRHTSLSN